MLPVVQKDELQGIVDALAERLGRSVAVDDPTLHLLAVSRHFGDEDQARVRAVLHRQADPEDVRFALSQGISQETTVRRLPGDRKLGVTARICVPVRWQTLLLGYLWLIDPESNLPGPEIDDAIETAQAIGLVLYRRQLAHERERARTEGLVRDLLSSDASARGRAEEEIRDDQWLGHARYVAAIAAEVRPVSGTGGMEVEVAIRSAVDYAVRPAQPGSTLTLTHGNRATLLMTGSREDAVVHGRDVGARFYGRVTEVLGSDSYCVVGLGSVQSLGSGIVSYGQARDAVRAAKSLPSFENVVAWEDLGVYALLLRLTPEDLTDAVYPAAIRRLVAADESGLLISTTETFLDHAGSSRQAAEALSIHRTTLYYRLSRIEEVTGLKFQSGNDRLMLHLGVKLIRMVEP